MFGNEVAWRRQKFPDFGIVEADIFYFTDCLPNFAGTSINTTRAQGDTALAQGDTAIAQGPLVPPLATSLLCSIKELVNLIFGPK